ncbi:MAG: hypothetical protein JRJ47_14235 [Deltaproteobacteria bacterium]|nr:hypothetical protein [Deltaproteobacteria bacterium]
MPAIAGGHHEKMDGTGYPRRLSRDDMPPTARMMAIADIFEALTAADRPYKKGGYCRHLRGTHGSGSPIQKGQDAQRSRPHNELHEKGQPYRSGTL